MILYILRENKSIVAFLIKICFEAPPPQKKKSTRESCQYDSKLGFLLLNSIHSQFVDQIKAWYYLNMQTEIYPFWTILSMANLDS